MYQHPSINDRLCGLIQEFLVFRCNGFQIIADFRICARSSPVSLSVPSKATSSGSIAGWRGTQGNGARQVSRIPPDRLQRLSDMTLRPCRWNNGYAIAAVPSRLFSGRNPGKSIIRRDQACHILDSDAVGTHILQDFCLVDIILKVKDQYRPF